jgi:hypothetical protein
VNEQRIWAVLSSPASGVSAEDFVTRYQVLHDRLAEAAPGAHIRLLRMNDEQLLPNRAAGAHHGYIALYEAAPGEFPPPGIDVPGVAGPVPGWIDEADLCVFAGDRIFDTTIPTTLPEGVPGYKYEAPAPGGPGVFWALSNPVSPDVEDKYNRWYDSTHSPDTLMQPGMVRARRYRRAADVPVTGSDYREQRYLAMYEVDDIAKISAARDSVEWMAQVSVDFRSVHFDGNSVRGFTFATLTEHGEADKSADMIVAGTAASGS